MSEEGQGHPACVVGGVGSSRGSDDYSHYVWTGTR